MKNLCTKAAAMAATLALLATLHVVGASPADAAIGEYPIRSTFYMDPQLPGGDGGSVTGCWEKSSGNGYVCRLIWGYEEAGGSGNFTITATNALRQGGNASYGSMIVTKSGATYEGCVLIDGGRSWYCDYKTAKYASRNHYSGSGYVLRVFWKWASYTGDQASCAAAISSFWGASGSLAVLLQDCKNGPM